MINCCSFDRDKQNAHMQYAEHRNRPHMTVCTIKPHHLCLEHLESHKLGGTVDMQARTIDLKSCKVRYPCTGADREQPLQSRVRINLCDRSKRNMRHHSQQPPLRTAKPFPLGENFTFETTRMVSTHKLMKLMSCLEQKSMFVIDLTMIHSITQTLSPVIDHG